MAYVMGFNLSQRDEKILEKLLSYRGVTAHQLTVLLINKSDYSLSEEKSVYNSLRKLKKQGLVVAHKLQETVAKGSMYHLSPKGYTLTLDLLDVETDQTSGGWLPHDSLLGPSFADLPYEIYSPPKKQTAHHLMLVDLFIQLLKLNEEILEGVPHRLNLYCSQDYYHSDGQYMKLRKFRPDGEILINSKRYTIEIDRAMETHEQLVQKFEVYKAYFEHCKKNEEPNTIKGIIFVVEDRRRMHGIKKRWASLLAAYVKVLYPEWQEVPLILTSLSSVADTVLEERLILDDKYEDIEKRTNALLSELASTSRPAHYFLGNESNKKYSHTLLFNDDNSYTNYNSALCQEYDTRLFVSYTYLHKNIVSRVKGNPEKYSKGYKFGAARTIIWYSEERRKPVLVDLSPYGVPPLLSGPFKKASEYIDFCCDRTIKEKSETMYPIDDPWSRQYT